MGWGSVTTLSCEVAVRGVGFERSEMMSAMWLSSSPVSVYLSCSVTRESTVSWV